MIKKEENLHDETLNFHFGGWQARSADNEHVPKGDEVDGKNI